MARKSDHVQISPPYAHQEGCADCGSDGRFEQVYTVPHAWTLVLLSRVAEAHGTKALIRKQRGGARDVVVKAHTAQALSAVETDFRKVLPLFSVEVSAAIDRLCAEHLKPVAELKP